MWLHLMVQTCNSTFFVEIELWWAMTSIKCLLASCLLLARLLGNLCSFNYKSPHTWRFLQAKSSRTATWSACSERGCPPTGTRLKRGSSSSSSQSPSPTRYRPKSAKSSRRFFLRSKFPINFRPCYVLDLVSGVMAENYAQCEISLSCCSSVD